MLRGQDASTAIAPPTRALIWPWALGTVLVVAVVLLTALGARHVIAGTRAATRVVAAPATPAAAVAGATPLSMHAQLVALDASAGHIVALTSATQPQCPPASACPPAPALTAFMVFDAATGQPLATTPLTAAAPASRSVLLLADAAHHVAYAIAPGTVTIFSTVSGAVAGSYTLPAPAWQRESGGALDERSGTLVLGGGSQISAFDAATGRPLASRLLTSGATVSGVTLDPATGSVYALLRQSGAARATLTIYDDATLTPSSQVALPSGARLGPLDTASDTLYLPGATDGQCAYSVRAARLVTTSADICDALALGWNSAADHLYTSDATGLTLRGATSGRPLAALPIRAAWPGDQPLPVDEARGLIYVPDTLGTILIVRDSSAPGTLTPGGALLLARAALADLLPNTNQDPPFVAPNTFPATPGAAPEVYWIHFSDLGWQGPYPGDAVSAVQSAPDGSGGYQVTFTISWNQLFRRTHSWTCDVSPAGEVRLASQTGDAVP